MKLTELKNIGPRLAQWLKDIGIATVEDLAGKDSFDVWVELHRVHPEANLNALMALEGAVLDLDWSDLPPSKKHQLEVKHAGFIKNEKQHDRQ